LKPQQLALVILALALASLGVVLTPLVAPNSAAARKVTPKLGLDIQGGARAVLEADLSRLPAGQKWDQDTKSAVRRTIENRVNANGVAEPVITPKGERQFVVEIPSVKNEKEILDQLQNTAQLEFFYSPDWKTNRNALGRYEFRIESDPTGKREQYTLLDATAGKTLRDRFHINQQLRTFIDEGIAAGDKAVDTPLPEPLTTLSAAAGAKSLKLTADAIKALPALAEELQGFDAFLKSARKELDGSDLAPKARGGFDPGGSAQAMVELEFNSKGRDKFAQFTRDHTNEILMIYLDGRILMAPNIQVPITNGKAVISPFATVSDAKQLADYLNGGSLPVPLKVEQLQSVEPTLGTSAVHDGVIAGLVGLAAIIVFMIAVYRLPGAIACGALLLYTLFTYAIFVLIPVTFTLPGIAGFILSVGMAVDANILIFERTKEEIAAGRPLAKAIETGFGRAFSAIFDSNLCTAITSILLYNFGTGSVRGFALTLLIGVLLSMFTAITVTRTFLILIRPSQASWGGGIWRPTLNVVSRRKIWYVASVLVIIPGLVLAGMGGFRKGIEFTGGSELTLSLPQPTTREAIEKAVAAQGFKDASAQVAGKQGDSTTVYVRLPKEEGKPETSAAEADTLVQSLQGEFPGATRQGFDLIGSSISSELTRNAFNSVLLSSLFIVLYLAFRFASAGFATGLKFGVAAIIAMLHDIGVLVGVFCALGYFLNWKVDSLFVTAALTVIGFSVHDTIIIFDRIRENQKRHGATESFSEIVSESINETFARSVYTSGTVLMTLLALLILGGPVIRPLNAALFVGILSGTYSSIFNAAPLVIDWDRLFGKKKGA
jgi:SecD/SecF fusion protein